MEKENLSQSFIQKYDSLSDSFVVVLNENTEEKTKNITNQRKFEPFSLFRFKGKSQITQDNSQPAQPQPTHPPHQQNSQPAQPPLATNQSVILSRDAYNQLKHLEFLYESLAHTDIANSNLYNDLASQTKILTSTMLSIYQLLSDTSNTPDQDHTCPVLTRENCIDRKLTENYIQEVLNTVLNLQRSVNVNNIDRQLAIISTTLLSQKSQLASLQASC